MKKIIWADDDARLMTEAEPLFYDYGFNIIKCNSISKALKEIHLGSTDNLLLDIDFPESPKEGLIFLEQLRIINPYLKVVLFTGFPEIDDAVIAIKKLMAYNYISKPIPVERTRRDKFFKKLHDAFGETNIELVKTVNDVNSSKINNIKTSLESCDIDSFIGILQSIFAGLSYNIKTNEGYYHGYIQIIMDLAGLKVLSEVETNIGRIDVVAETEKFLYLMEFKLSDPLIAIQQIKDRKYFQKYFTSSKQIVLVGISFDNHEKNINGYSIEKLKNK